MDAGQCSGIDGEYGGIDSSGSPPWGVAEFCLCAGFCGLECVPGFDAEGECGDGSADEEWGRVSETGCAVASVGSGTAGDDVGGEACAAPGDAGVFVAGACVSDVVEWEFGGNVGQNGCGFAQCD